MIYSEIELNSLCTNRKQGGYQRRWFWR